MLVTAMTWVPAVRGGTVIASSPSVMVRSALGRSLFFPSVTVNMAIIPCCMWFMPSVAGKWQEKT